MRFLQYPLIAAAIFLVLSSAGGETETVKVFVLAGQSNMEGKVQSKLMNFQAEDPKTKDLFKHLRNVDGWITRNDVMINYLKEHGGLTVGYGSRDRTGVELEFGWKMGDHFDQPVLLIKTAWGGHSLVKAFRPPSAGLPTEEKLADELEQAQMKVRNKNEKHQRKDPLPTMAEIKSGYGGSYRMMLEEVDGIFANYETLFPSLKGKKLEIVGFVWFQGWNDQYNGAEKEYQSNMRHLITDLRRDLESPAMPFVIGIMGQNGSKPATGAMLTIQQAQQAMEDVPEFKGNVRAVRTDILADKTAEALYPRWKENIPEWEKTGSDRPYHYLGSAIWHLRMGDAFADAMVEMMK